MVLVYTCEILVLTGVEGMEQVSAIRYGGSIFTAQYSHSLVSVMAMALLSAWLGARLWGRIGGMMLGGLTFSHWQLEPAQSSQNVASCSFWHADDVVIGHFFSV